MQSTRQPQRVQLRRTKGWRKPEGAVVVARPSRWGNPYRVGSITPEWRDRLGWPYAHTRASAVAAFRARYENDPEYRAAVVRDLAGKDLACWCPLEDPDGNRVPCHADVLLEMANR